MSKTCKSCTRTLAESAFLEYRKGLRRDVCRECFNANRRNGHSPAVPTVPAPKSREVEETIDVIIEHRLKKKNKELEEKNADLVKQLSEGGDYAEVVLEVLARQRERKPPVINPREKKSKLLEGTPLFLASDWHVEEEVKPSSVAGRNRYTLDIAKQRMTRFFEAVRWAIKHQREVFKIRDAIGWFGGDFITNFLHDDDAESNQLSPLEAILFAQQGIIDGLTFLLEDPELEQLIVPFNDGNHGREPNTRRMRNATRPEHSLEVFMYAQIATHFRNEKRIRFIMPTSQFTFLDNVYGKTIRFLHGDVFKYGGGIGGITVPMLRALARWESVKKADLTCMGHWHQRFNMPNVMVNGSLIGYNAYAMGGGFPFEAPVQSMRMLDSKRFCAADIPLFVSERADDSNNKL